MESFLTHMARLMDEAGLPGLMIGGHAVTALGHARATYDLDLLVPRSALARWEAELGKLRFRVFAESGSFKQFEASADLPLPPVDLMIVDDEVFAAFERDKVPSAPIATPGVAAMVALKLHAAHQASRTDAERDWSDIIALVKHHQLTLDDPQFAAIVLKHGGPPAQDRIRAVTG